LKGIRRIGGGGGDGDGGLDTIPQLLH